MPLTLITTLYSLSTWFEFLIGPAEHLKSPEESGGREVGESVTFQLGLGGFPVNYTDKVCFLEKIDKKQLATG